MSENDSGTWTNSPQFLHGHLANVLRDQRMGRLTSMTPCEKAAFILEKSMFSGFKTVLKVSIEGGIGKTCPHEHSRSSSFLKHVGGSSSSTWVWPSLSGTSYPNQTLDLDPSPAQRNLTSFVSSSFFFERLEVTLEVSLSFARFVNFMSVMVANERMVGLECVLSGRRGILSS